MTDVPTLVRHRKSMTRSGGTNVECNRDLRPHRPGGGRDGSRRRPRHRDLRRTRRVGRGHRSARRQRRGTERRCGGRRGDGASCARHRDGCLRSGSCRARVRRDRRCARQGRHPRQPRLHADLRHPARDPARRLGEGAPHQSDQLPPLRAAGCAPDDRAGNRRRGHEHVLDRGHFRLRPRELSLQREQGRRRDDDEGDGGRMGRATGSGSMRSSPVSS